MKLIITGVDKDKVSYVEGVEVEVTVDQMKARIQEIDNLLKDNYSDTFEASIESAKAAVQQLINSKKIEIEEKHIALNKEFEGKRFALDKELEDYVAEAKTKEAESIAAITQNFNEEKEGFEALTKEKAKLMAILSNIEAIEPEIPEAPAEEIKPEEAPVVAEEPVVEEKVEEPAEEGVVLETPEEAIETQSEEETQAVFNEMPKAMTGESMPETSTQVEESKEVEEVKVEPASVSETEEEVPVQPPVRKKIIF